MSILKKAFTLCLSVGLVVGMGSVHAANDDALTRDECAIGCDCKPNDCKVTCFSGHLGVNPCRKLLTNFIDPVERDSEGKCIAATGDKAHTCFSGHVGIDKDKGLWVNTICPVEDAETDCAACPDGLQNCKANLCGTTCFTGNVAIERCRTLRVRRLQPAGPDCNQGNPNGNICIDGNLSVDECKTMFVNFIDPSRNFIPEDGCQEECDENFQLCGRDNRPDAITCFSGHVGVNKCKTLLVNRIDPVKMQRGQCDGKQQ